MCLFVSAMFGTYLLICVVTLLGNISDGKTLNEKLLRLNPLSTCTYDYEVSVYTARGAQTTASDGYQLHALVRLCSVVRLKNDIHCWFWKIVFLLAIPYSGNHTISNRTRNAPPFPASSFPPQPPRTSFVTSVEFQLLFCCFVSNSLLVQRNYYANYYLW